MSEILKLNISKDYDVNWSLDFIIRDYFQNYFDSVKADPKNLSFENDVDVTVNYSESYCAISGSVIFDWEDLPIIGGTTKKDKNIFAGGFGEGFLIATLCLLKLIPTIRIKQIVGDVELIPFFDSDGKRQILCFEKKVIENKIKGSRLEFFNCDSAFLRIFSNGKSYFNYPENKLFKTLLFNNKELGITIYEIDDKNGRIFYRFQDRGIINSSKYTPIALCYDYESKEIPNTRDRIDLQLAEKNRIFEKTLPFCTDEFSIKNILDLLSKDFAEGNQVLKYLSEAAQKLVKFDYTTKTVDKKIYDFSERFIAQDLNGGNWEIKDFLKRQGYTFCPDYFRYFGMQSAQKMAKAIEDKQRAEKFRDPNIYENRKFNLAYDFYESIFGKKNLRKPLTIFVSELKKGEYTSSSIYLNETVFYNFSEFTATFLHEVAHIKGYDGSSNFTDILTLLIQNLLESHLKISTYKLKWDEINDEQLYSNNKNVFCKSYHKCIIGNTAFKSNII